MQIHRRSNDWRGKMKESRTFCKSGIAGLFLAALAFVSGAAAEDATVYIDRYGNVVKQVFAVPQTFDTGAGKTAAGEQAGTPRTGTAGLQGETGGTASGAGSVTVVVTDTVPDRCGRCDGWRYTRPHFADFPGYWYPYRYHHPHFYRWRHNRHFRHH